MNQQIRRDRAFWQELVQRYEAGTTQTQRQFALDHGVSFSSFKYWLYKLRHAQPQNHSPSFIDLTPSDHSQSIVLSTAAMLRLPDDLVLEFPALPQPDYLAALLRSLRTS